MRFLQVANCPLREHTVSQVSSGEGVGVYNSSRSTSQPASNSEHAEQAGQCLITRSRELEHDFGSPKNHCTASVFIWNRHVSDFLFMVHELAQACVLVVCIDVVVGGIGVIVVFVPIACASVVVIIIVVDIVGASVVVVIIFDFANVVDGCCKVFGWLVGQARSKCLQHQTCLSLAQLDCQFE